MQQLAAPNQPSNPAFSYFKNIGTIYYVKNLGLHRVNVQTQLISKLTINRETTMKSITSY